MVARRPSPTSTPTRGDGRAAARGAILAAAVMGAAACWGPNAALWAPTPEMLESAAPDSFVAEFVTSEGAFQVTLRREWSPLGVDRAFHLIANDFYAGARFYRVLPGFVSQWGFSGDPALDSTWRDLNLEDEPVVASNVRGTVSFARGGPESRSITLFVNTGDNSRLDGMPVGGVVGYPPVGEVTRGMEVVDGFYAAYLERPDQDSIAQQGNAYLRRAFPQLDSIVSTRILRSWP